jgi:hypothetical protein
MLTNFGIGTLGRRGEGGMKKLWVVVLIVCSAGPAHAFTCSNVRALSHEQQAYYIKAFNITPAQQQRMLWREVPPSGDLDFGVTVPRLRVKACDRPARIV